MAGSDKEKDGGASESLTLQPLLRLLVLFSISSCYSIKYLGKEKGTIAKPLCVLIP